MMERVACRDTKETTSEIASSRWHHIRMYRLRWCVKYGGGGVCRADGFQFAISTGQSRSRLYCLSNF